MAALTANKNIVANTPGDLSVRVVDAAVVFWNALVAAENEENGTAGKRGLAQKWGKTAGQIPLGLAYQPVTGDAAALPPPSVSIDATRGRIVNSVAVAGGADSVADQFKLVYQSTDNVSDMTFTRPTAPAIPIGIAIRWLSSGIYDVYGFSWLEMANLALAGGDRALVDFGCIGVGVAGPAPKTLAGIVKATFHGKLISVSARCLIGPTDANVDIDAQVEINSVATTGGALKLKFDDVAGDVKAGSGITGANFIHDGDDLSIVATTITADGTDTDPGLYQVFGIVQKMLGI